ncbi:ABC transporter permease [Streptomyces hoynatensis]|uniref:ABC transporter permease n=1 Tax=Streptomyces hoynatensis TaxID=1141874 RepID=A0A3A9Z6B2_9ACTN|nr:ABC transporter permease [Streptomyces hoynatensis]RKN43813.1 ABC transporter permease [Streptomyces hoynatensis]
MRTALHAEWTKLRTAAGPRWLLLGTIVATVALSTAATSMATCTAGGCGGDTTRLALTGVCLGQATIAILAAQTIGGEYGTGMIRSTLAAVPRRGTAFAAKAVALTGVVALGGTAAALGSVLAGRLVLPESGDRALSLAGGPTLRAVLGTVLYLVLIGLLSLGIATAVRDSATGVGLVLGLLYVLPILSATVGDLHWRRLLERAAPMSAGLSVQDTTDPGGPSLGPWAGLGVTAGWAAAALLAGGLLLRARDV